MADLLFALVHELVLGAGPRAFPAESPEALDEFASCDRHEPAAHLAMTRCTPSMLGMSSSPSSSLRLAQSMSTDSNSSRASSEESPKPHAPSIPATVATNPAGVADGANYCVRYRHLSP